ncbi:hypothetical protein [Chamaesiphon polymorphus]|uniref:hypothetical protein n=1 Tax=Chamaesiphon polymorphus TaxID=2107691 RepID=UPI0015E66557|nr:hypothetical protein [Chamaesiphon polymorphus]
MTVILISIAKNPHLLSLRAIPTLPFRDRLEEYIYGYLAAVGTIASLQANFRLNR